MIAPAKLLTYGAVTFIPAAAFDEVSTTRQWRGQTIESLEPSEDLPGFLGWFPLRDAVAPKPADVAPDAPDAGAVA